MTKLDQLLAAAQIVVDLHERREHEHHRMTGANFMRRYPDHGDAVRNLVLGQINYRLTEAIWALGKMLCEFEKDVA